MFERHGGSKQNKNFDELAEKMKAGATTVTFKNSSGTLEHNCGFVDTNYALIFIPTTSSYFPMMSKPIDGNQCQIILRDWTNPSGSITVKNFSGTAIVGWIAIKV